jgi:hypothetical protein
MLRDQLIVYILEASAIAIVGKVVIGRSPIDTGLFILIATLAAANIVMDLYAPRISPSMRQGAGFGLGMKQVGGNPMLITMQLKQLKTMVSDLKKAKEKEDTVQLTILPGTLKSYAKSLADRGVINEEINSKFENFSKDTSVDELNTIIDMLDEKIGGDNRTPKEIYDAMLEPTPPKRLPKLTPPKRLVNLRSQASGIAAKFDALMKNNPPPDGIGEETNTLEIIQYKIKMLPKMIALNEESLRTKDYMGRTKEQVELGLQRSKKELQELLEAELESELETRSLDEPVRVPEPEELIKKGLRVPDEDQLTRTDLNTLRECKRFLNSGLDVEDFTKSQINTLFKCKNILQPM